MNAVVQGSAADLMKLALIRLHNALPDDVRMLLPVHDSVCLNCRKDWSRKPARSSRPPWKPSPTGFSVRLKVEVKTGRTWAECKSS